jgi:hypothetical protein
VLVVVLDGSVSPELRTCLLDCSSFVSTLCLMSTRTQILEHEDEYEHEKILAFARSVSLLLDSSS